jgi:CRP/FNR family transcriptional regulator, cyclic AMP receptor protein
MNPNPFWQNIFRNQAGKQTLTYFLSQVPIFNKLSQRELKFLEKIVHIRNFEADEMVFSTGDIGSGMYIIRSGQVQIFSVDSDGKEHEQANLEPGDFFGEVALTGTRPRTAAARTTTATSLVGLFRSDILEASIRHPAPTAKILFGLNRVLADRLLQCSQQLELLQATIKHPQEPHHE